MTEFRLIGGPNSPFVRKVLLALIEKGLAERTELIRVNPPAAMMVVNPGLLALNPLGKIPVLDVVGGPRLYESDLICEYLDTNYGQPTLIPPPGPERWRALEWNALATGGMELLILWRGERLRAAEMRSADLMAACEAKVDAILAAMDRDLRDLSRTPFGLAHIAWVCFLGYLDFRFDDLDWRSRWPGGIRWFEQAMMRPGMVATLPEMLPPNAHSSEAPLQWREG